MNVTSYVQNRQYGFPRQRKMSQRKMEYFLETKLSQSFVNKACEISGKCRATFVMQFSPDGTKVASTHGDHTVRVTEIATGKCLHTLRGHPRTPWSLAYHPSYSNIVASGCLGGQVRIWDLYGHGCEVWDTENSSVVAALAFHPTDQVLVIAAGNAIYFWDWTKPEPFAKCSTNHDYERIRWIHFDSLGHTLYTGISNNTSVHRDQLSSISHLGEERPQTTSQPSRLSSVYNNIVNYYQDYRRDRLFNQLAPTDSSGLPVATGIGSVVQRNLDSGPGFDAFPELHSEGIVRPSSPGSPPRPPLAGISGPTVTLHSLRSSEDHFATYASQISRASRQADSQPRRRRWHYYEDPRFTTPERNRNTRPSTQSIFGSLPETERDLLLNPTFDPFLSAARDSSGSELDNSSSGIISAQRRRITDESSFGRHHLPSINITEDVEIPLEAVTGQYVRPQTNCVRPNTLPSHREQVDSNAEASGAVKDARSNCLTSVSQSVASHSTNNSQKRSSSESCQTTTNSDNKVSMVAPTSTLLSRFLHRPTQKLSETSATSSSSAATKVFPSIRERLQLSIPLSTETTSANKGKVTLAQTTGIPKVTVIMSSHTNESCRVSVAGANSLNQSGINSTLNTCLVSSTMAAGVNTSTGCLRSSAELHLSANLSVTRSDTGVPVQSSINNLDAWMPLSASSSTVVSSSRQACITTATNVLVPSVTINVPTVVASTSSHSTLFENIFHNSSTVAQTTGASSAHLSTRGRNYLPSFRSQPYNWQSRGRYLSLMGPYLQSRGVNPTAPENLSCPAEVSSNEGVPARLQSTGRESATFQCDQASSDTESELSSHLHSSGAYFLPIPEDQLRAASSTSLRSSGSLDRNTDPSVLRQFNTSTGSADSLQGRISTSDSSQGQRSESAHSQRSRSGSTEGQRSRSNSQEYEVELVVDQNENYTTNRNVHPDVPQREEIVHRSHDSNNNSIHISVNSNRALNSISQRFDQRNNDYVRLRDSFVSMTDQIEREMNDLNRRINALRDSFSESIRSLRHDRRRYESLDGHLPAETATNLGPHDAQGVNDLHAEIGATHVLSLPGATGLDTDNENHTGAGVPISQPPTLLETSLRSHTQGRRPLHPRNNLHGDEEAADDTHHWRTLQRHYLHPHYSSSILDDTINRPNNVIQSAINRAIAGAFMGTGESAVANNIISQTHRIQFWDFSKCIIPDITQSKLNIVVPHCKLHNSASANISQDNTLLATFVPNHHGFPDNNILAVYSLVPETRGQCLYTKQFGPNAVSVSISPSNSYILVCLAARRLSWVFTNQQLVAHIYKLEKKQAGENSMKHVKDVDHICSSDVRTHVSGNSASWLPLPGQGLVYGTNRGDLHICRPGVKVVAGKADLDGLETDMGSDNSFQRLFGQVPWRVYSSPNRVSTSTQTAGVRRSAGTQTPQNT